MERIPVSGPWITELEIECVKDAVATAWYANANVYHDRFEAAFSRYVGRRFAVALPSCTSALHLALLALGVGPGDEVVVPDATWIASAAPITYVGAEPVFADIDRRSWCLSPEAFEAAVTPRTRAVIVVDLYGGMPEMEPILAIARRNGITVLEDAAEAIGSEYRGKRAGSFGDASVFSFHGSKTLTTGEGGMLVTDKEALYRRVLFLRDHGRQPGDVQFYNTEIGYKYKMSSMQAALGYAQLQRVDELLDRKRQMFEWYTELMASQPNISLNPHFPDTSPVFWMVTAVWPPDLRVSKQEIVMRMAERGVDCRPFFHPLSSLPAYRGLRAAEAARHRNSAAYDIGSRAINLPSGFNLTPEIAKGVAAEFLDVLRASRC